MCGSGDASLTGFNRTTHAWDRISAGTPAHAVIAVTAVPSVVGGRAHSDRRARRNRRDSSGDGVSLTRPSVARHGPAVTAMTALIVGSRIARAVSAVIAMPAVTAVTRQAFIARSEGHGPPRATGSP
jgi:hypothetical protein